MASGSMDRSLHVSNDRVALAIFLALGGAAGLVFGLSFLPWGFVTGTGEFWQSAESDRATAVIGYLYFVADAWRLPLYHIGTLNVPEGASVITTGSIPPLALAMKVLHTFGVPPWNYFGAWLLCCYALSGVAMALVLWHAGIRAKGVAVVSALLAAGMPVLLHRWYHFSLCAQFLILLALACYVAVARARRPASTLTAAAVLVVVSLDVNPYLGAMVLALYVATLARAACGGAVSWRQAVSHFALTCLVLVALMVLLGYVSFGGRSLAPGGFGHFSANLLSPFASNLSGLAPEAWERLRAVEAAGTAWPFFDRAWPDATGGQYVEGFGYLGVGLLLLCALHAPYLVRNGVVLARRHWPLLGVLAAATLFALSNKVFLGDHLIAYIPMSPVLYSLVDVFRSSGRFLWLVEYAALAGATILTVRRFGAGRGVAILAAATALQLFDTTPLRQAIALDARITHSAGIEFEPWKPWLSAGLDRVYIIPSYSCGDPDFGNPKLSLQYYMARVGPIPTNSAYTSRARPDCGAEIRLLTEVADGGRVGWVFFADGLKLPEVERFRTAKGTTCQPVGSVLACTRGANGADAAAKP